MTTLVALSDDGKRLRDEYNMHRSADPYGSIGKWISFPLARGGSSDHILYDNKRDAVRHVNGDESRYCFLQITPRTMNGREAETLLNTHRKMADAGFRMADPDDSNGGRDVIKRGSTQDQNAQFGAMFGMNKPSNITHGLDSY